MSETHWLGFGLTGSITKTFLHFMPQSSGVGAPYPVNFSLTVGGSTLPSRTINIEGARLGQPDGFRMEEAIPALTQLSSGLFYIKVNFNSSTHRLNLQTSSLTIELQYQQSGVAYRPSILTPGARKVITAQSANALSIAESTSDNLEDSQNLSYSKPAFAIRDPNLYPMLVLINSSSQHLEAKILSLSNREFVHSVHLEPESIREYEPAELGLKRSVKLDCASGAVELELFQVVVESVKDAQNLSSGSQIIMEDEQKKGAATAAYIVYRNRNSRRIASVIGL